MPWKKGQSGNPLGRLPGEKQFADQLRIVLAEPVDKNDPKSVRKMPPSSRRSTPGLKLCRQEGLLRGTLSAPLSSPAPQREKK
jgi:Family of unknown function (DUF5681)